MAAASFLLPLLLAEQFGDEKAKLIAKNADFERHELCLQGFSPSREADWLKKSSETFRDTDELGYKSEI